MPVLIPTSCASCGRQYSYGLDDLAHMLLVIVWPAPGRCPHCGDYADGPLYETLERALPLVTYHQDGIWNIH